MPAKSESFNPSLSSGTRYSRAGCALGICAGVTAGLLLCAAEDAQASIPRHTATAKAVSFIRSRYATLLSTVLIEHLTFIQDGHSVSFDACRASPVATEIPERFCSPASLYYKQFSRRFCPSCETERRAQNGQVVSAYE